jgi:Flp pilus assembly protein TadG
MRHLHNPSLRRGKVLVFFLIALPAILGLVGLVFDAGLMSSDQRNLQHAVDAGAQAGALDLWLGKTASQAQATALDYIQNRNGASGAQVTVQIPPADGAYAGQSGFLEVTATVSYNTRVMHLLGIAPQQTLTAQAVAGYEPSTAGGAIQVLDPNPASISVESIPAVLPSLPALIGSLEVLGAGTVRVNGAVFVNSEWGGVDENGNPAGNSTGPPYAISCTPIIALTNLQARDIRVVGGVDSPKNYSAFTSGDPNPLKANQLPVPDPFKSLPVPTTTSDPNNVSAVSNGGVKVVSLPLIGTPKILQPGVYDWIEVDSGTAIFEPGIYIIRSVNPTSQIALNLLGGTITANGVMFYITNSANYSPTDGSPDASDGENSPATHGAGTLIPSTVINTALLGSSFSPLADSASPFNGLLVYQRREDYRPIVIANQSLLGGGTVSGTIYAKWGHVILVGSSTYDIKIVSGTARLLAILDMTIAPSALLPPAQDVFLVQ